MKITLRCHIVNGFFACVDLKKKNKKKYETKESVCTHFGGNLTLFDCFWKINRLSSLHDYLRVLNQRDGNKHRTGVLRISKT